MQKKWWQEAVVYEIYCKSFCDSNGDGIGDLPGVISKLPMLKELGINCIWFTPIFTSPQVDNGYDVADYRNIDPAYGTLEDFKVLLEKAHELGIRILLDMVLNHSSDEHIWFQESRKSKDNPYRNYYIWQPPKADGTPPNNWGNYFREGDGSAWEYDETTGEYYLHQYSIKMPDLNWEYAPLRQEIVDMLTWWLDMGVDGFRFDVFTRFKKPAGFPDSPKTPDPKLDRNGYVVDVNMCTCQPGIHELWKDLWAQVFSKYDCFTVGEGSGIVPANAPDYTSQSSREIDCAYHFQLNSRKRAVYSNADFRRVQKDWYEVMKHNTWITQYLSNHDQPRPVSHHGSDGEYRVETAKLLGTITHMMPGTPFVYQGEEMGMTNVAFDDIEDYNCRYTVGDYHSMVKNGYTKEEAIAFIQPRSRDNARTPYQWDDSENAGFSTGTPWMKVNPRYKEVNLKKDRASKDSVFSYYQKLLEMRKTCPAVLDGDLTFYLEDDPNVIMFTRQCARQTLLIIANRSYEAPAVELPEELKQYKWKRILTNREETVPSLDDGRSWLPWECEVYSLDI